MNKLKFLTIVIIALLVTNIALVGFIVLKKPPRPKENGPRNLIIEKLKLDENQVIEYDKLIEWHRTEIRKTEHDIMLLKNQLYDNLSTNPSTTIKDSLVHELSEAQAKIENTHYKHFEDLKNICHDNQKPAFESLTHEIASLFGRAPNKGENK